MKEQPIKKVVPEPKPTAMYEGRLAEGTLDIDIQDTGATLVVTVRGARLTPQSKRKLVARYPNAIIVDEG
jgi:hypothetical protein